jgi:hypothetical protein
MYMSEMRMLKPDFQGKASIEGSLNGCFCGPCMVPFAHWRNGVSGLHSVCTLAVLEQLTYDTQGDFTRNWSALGKIVFPTLVDNAVVTSNPLFDEGPTTRKLADECVSTWSILFTSTCSRLMTS